VPLVVLVAAVLVAAVLVATAPARSGAAGAARTWTARDLRILAGTQLSIALHPDVEPIVVTGDGGAFEVCPANMDGGIPGGPGQSWPPYAGFRDCIASDADGRVELPSIVLPMWHVAFLVRGRGGATVRLDRLEVREVPGDGFFEVAAPTGARASRSMSFTIVPSGDATIEIEPTTGGSPPTEGRVRVEARQGGQRAPRTATTIQLGASSFGPLRPGEPVGVLVTDRRPEAGRIAYGVRWE
jgi:hypothetical protein